MADGHRTPLAFSGCGHEVTAPGVASGQSHNLPPRGSPRRDAPMYSVYVPIIVSYAAACGKYTDGSCTMTVRGDVVGPKRVSDIPIAIECSL